MSTTQIKDGYNGGSDNGMKVNVDGSINTNSTGSSTVTGTVKIEDTAGNALTSTAGALNVVSSGSSTVSGTVSTNVNGLANFKTTQYTVGTSSVQLVTPALSNRTSVGFKAVCTGANAIYIGNSSGVTSSTGYPLFNGDTLQLDLTGASSPYAIASAAGQSLYVLEIG